MMNQPPRWGVRNFMMNQFNAIRTLIVDDSEDECLLLHLELRHVASIKLIGFVHDGMEALAYLSGTDRFRNRESAFHTADYYWDIGIVPGIFSLIISSPKT